MQQIFRAISLLAVLPLAACGGTTVSDLGPTLAQPGAPMQTAPLQPAPSQQIAAAQAMTDVTAFVDPAAVRLMSERDKTEAASAQFNALQFGRAGAPRAWTGGGGASGQVVVGPPVNVNSLYCRDFTHTVNVGGAAYIKKAMACRELDGRWNVVAAS
jgi:surface antigen